MLQRYAIHFHDQIFDWEILWQHKLRVELLIELSKSFQDPCRWQEYILWNLVEVPHQKRLVKQHLETHLAPIHYQNDSIFPPVLKLGLIHTVV